MKQIEFTEFEASLDDLRKLDSAENELSNSMSEADSKMSDQLILNSQILYLDFDIYQSISTELQKEKLKTLLSGINAIDLAKARLEEEGLASIHELLSLEQFQWNAPLPFEHTMLYLGNKSKLLFKLLDMVVSGEYEKLTLPCAFFMNKTHVFLYYYTIDDRAGTELTDKVYASIVPIVREGVPIIKSSQAALILPALELIMNRINERGWKQAGPSYSIKAQKAKRGGKSKSIPHSLRIVSIGPSQYRIQDYLKSKEEHHVRQHEVCEHDATWVMRGDLPLDDKLRRHLQKDERRVIIEDDAQITPRIAEIFDRRGIVRRIDEWISVLTVRRKQHTRGSGEPVETVRVANKLFT